jgi:hypothetical protein
MEGLGPPVSRPHRASLNVALSDLLWACPECGEVGGIDARGTCRCGVTFSRGKGSVIVARFPDHSVRERSPAAWVDRLPPVERLLDTEDAGVVRRAAVLAREALATTPVRKGGRFLNRIEQYGPKRQGTLEMRLHALIYTPEGEGGREWPFAALTAVQTSSGTLQLKIRDYPLVSLRFLDDSLVLWEALLHTALRKYYRRTGRGEIAEFQPRIVTR